MYNALHKLHTTRQSIGGRPEVWLRISVDRKPKPWRPSVTFFVHLPFRRKRSEWAERLGPLG